MEIKNNKNHVRPLKENRKDQTIFLIISNFGPNDSRTKQKCSERIYHIAISIHNSTLKINKTLSYFNLRSTHFCILYLYLAALKISLDFSGLISEIDLTIKSRINNPHPITSKIFHCSLKYFLILSSHVEEDIRLAA